MKKSILSIVLILVVASLLRFYRLAQVPHGMTWDEAAIGYNGYAVLTTRRDEWLQRLPVSFQSFGDYKAPLAIYLNGFFTFIFGMNLWAVRFPFVVSSIFAVLGMILITKEVLKKFEVVSKEKIRFFSLLAGLILTFSPWHLHYSRAGFESGMSMMFLVWGGYFLYRFLRVLEKRIERQMLWLAFFIFLSTTFFIASMYTYHSAKIVAPFLAGTILLFDFKKIWKKLGFKTRESRRFLLTFFATLAYSTLLLRPMILDSILGEGLTRSGTLIFGQDLPALNLIKSIFLNFLAHFSPNFLLFGQTTTLRHGDGVWGVLLPMTFLVILYISIRYLLSFFSKKIVFQANYKKLFMFSWMWIILGILPAAVGVEIPHSNRALLALPGFIFLATLGIIDFIEYLEKWSQKGRGGRLKMAEALFIPASFSFHKKGGFKMKSVLGMMVLIHILTISSYLNNYFTNFSSQSAEAFNDGYLEAFSYVLPYEKGLDGKKEVDKIVFTSEYGQPYIYALFVRKTNPIWYRGGSLIKYEFKEKIDIGDLSRKKAIIVAGKSSNLSPENADELIYGSNGKIRFKIYHTDHE